MLAEGQGPRSGSEPAGTSEHTDAGLRAIVCLLALLSVAPLLAWVYGLGSFAAWYWGLSVPALVALIGVAVWVGRGGQRPALTVALRAGAIGGLLGTIGYDLVRVPFNAAGVRLLSPIDSYGLLIVNAVSSSPVTGFAGWFFHATNGVCFGVAFAAVAARRPLWWAVAWAMVLETATIVSPFVDRYGLSGHPELIVVAYGAHVAYGVPLGLMCRNPERTSRQLDEVTPHATALALLAPVVALALWQRPWSTPAAIADGRRVAPGPSAVVRDDRFSPAWLRVPTGGCASVRNDDPEVHAVDGMDVTLEPARVTKLCPTGTGVHRIKLDGKARSGGFVLVDPEAGS